MPGMPHRFGCIATDWLSGTCPPARFHNWSQCCHFGWSLYCSDA